LLRSLHSIQYPSDLIAVVIVDDGSAAALTREDLAGVAESFSELRIIRLPENQGVARALNSALTTLLKREDYKYIARLDCGDICVEERFAKQVTYLEAHPDVWLVGTGVQFKNFDTGKGYTYQHKLEYDDIQREMHFKCSFIHPSVMFRKEVLQRIGLYPENFPHCEDYAFFYQITRMGKAINLPDILLVSEISENGVSSQNRKLQLLSRLKIISKFGTNPVLKTGGVMRMLLLLLAPFRLVRYLNTLK